MLKGGAALLCDGGSVEVATAFCCHAGNSRKDAGAADAAAGAAAGVTLGSSEACDEAFVSSDCAAEASGSAVCRDVPSSADGPITLTFLSHLPFLAQSAGRQQHAT